MPKLEISILKQTLQFLEFLDFLDYALDFYSSIVKCLVQANISKININPNKNQHSNLALRLDWPVLALRIRFKIVIFFS